MSGYLESDEFVADTCAAIEALRELGAGFEPGQCIRLAPPPTPPDVQARLDARTPDEVIRDERLFDELIDGLYERCGIARSR